MSSPRAVASTLVPAATSSEFPIAVRSAGVFQAAENQCSVKPLSGNCGSVPLLNANSTSSSVGR